MPFLPQNSQMSRYQAFWEKLKEMIREKEKCPICLDVFDRYVRVEKEKRSVSLVSCGHIYHTHCLLWILKVPRVDPVTRDLIIANMCPECRANLHTDIFVNVPSDPYLVEVPPSLPTSQPPATGESSRSTSQPPATGESAAAESAESPPLEATFRESLPPDAAAP